MIKITKTFPNYQQIRLLNNKLTKGIKYFGGIAEVAKRMGCSPPSQIVATDGHYVRSSYEFFIDNFLFLFGIKHSVDGYINRSQSNFRYDFKVSNVFIEVWGYAQSKSKIAQEYQLTKRLKEEFYSSNKLTCISFYPKDFHEDPKNIKDMIRSKLNQYITRVNKRTTKYKLENLFRYYGYWTKENTVKQLMIAIQKHGSFPSERQLRKDQQSSLAFAMNKHGGVNHFKQMLGFDIKKNNQKYWTEKEITKQISRIIQKIRRFPSSNDLIRLKESKLEAAIAHKGGFRKYQQLLGYSPKHKRDGFYQSKDNILAECQKIYLQLGHFPSATELSIVKENTLRRAISKMGGYQYFRALVMKTK